MLGRDWLLTLCVLQCMTRNTSSVSVVADWFLTVCDKVTIVPSVGTLARHCFCMNIIHVVCCLGPFTIGTLGEGMR